MARYTGPSCRLCRREGQKLFLKGDRCYSQKCSMIKRDFAPGQHGTGRKKISNYGHQLREKQKAKRFYGLLESQFRSYFEKANKQPGITGENLLSLLETRLDNAVFRMGLGSSRKEARQLVRHGHFTVNGHKENIPSFQVKAGDVIQVKEKSASSPKFQVLKELDVNVPTWMTVDKEKLEGKILSAPRREEIDTEVEEHLIVELYSKL